MVGTGDVEIAYNTYIADPTEENLQAFKSSRPRNYMESIEKKEYMKIIQDSLLPWDKRLEKHLFEKKNQILKQLCQDNLINHLSGNNKAQLVTKLVSHFQEKPGTWNLNYSNSDKKFVITELSSQTKDNSEEMSSQNSENEENVITNRDGDQGNVMTKSEKEKNVITKPKKDDYIHLRISSNNKTKIQEKATQAGYKSVSKYIIDVMTDSKDVITNREMDQENVITNNMKHRRLHDRIDALEKDRKLLLKLIKIFIREGPNTEENDLTEEDIELIKKHSGEALKNA